MAATQVISFFVAGLPKAMSIGGRAIRTKTGATFTTRRNNQWAELVGYIGRQHAPERPLEGPLVFRACFELPRPKNAKPGAWPIKRPDVDNLIHKLSDQWNGCFYLDDSQIVQLEVRKHYCLDGRSGVHIAVEPADPAQPGDR